VVATAKPFNKNFRVEMALSLLKGEKQLEIIPGATHLFEEPGALEQVAQLASQWFTRYLAS
jgi:putative phosphoribosyl transferase